MTVTFHIRRAGRRSRSNSRYLDRSVQKVVTYCGREPTIYDAGPREKAQPWCNKAGSNSVDGPLTEDMHFEPCPECFAIRESEPKKNRLKRR